MDQPRPPITGSAHPLPFEKLSPEDFERLCLWLVEREGYERAEHLGAAGKEQGRDIVAWRGGVQWAFQCKRYKRINAATLKEEVTKCDALAKADPAKRPAGIVFVTSAVVSARVRDEVAAYCRERGYACDFWARTELDMRVKNHPEVVEEFFDAGYARPDRLARMADLRPGAMAPSYPPDHPTTEAPDVVPRRAWALVALLTLDFCLLIFWGWCLFGHRPNLIAYLGTVFTVVAVPLAILISVFFVRRPIALEDALRRLGTGKNWARVVLGLSGIAIAGSLLFWPLGWVGHCGSTPKCPVVADTDTETLFALIDAEAQAVLTEDIELIKDIFASDASIRNEATDEEWDSPEAYYVEKFRNEVHCETEHFDHDVPELTDTEAQVTTANRGRWGWEAEGCTEEYENPGGADQWVFRRDALGCWRISQFTFNAHNR